MRREISVFSHLALLLVFCLQNLTLQMTLLLVVATIHQTTEVGNLYALSSTSATSAIAEVCTKLFFILNFLHFYVESLKCRYILNTSDLLTYIFMKSMLGNHLRGSCKERIENRGGFPSYSQTYFLQFVTLIPLKHAGYEANKM